MATRERLTLAAATLLAAIGRLVPLARTPWDWDELLFMEALDRYDVASHRPHPPGFPLYIFAGKVIRKLGFGDFHALQALSVVAAILIVPAMFFLCRALGMSFRTSLGAAMILAFFPNVWFYGGGAFSDVPSMVLVIVAVALLVRAGGVSESAQPRNLSILLGATALAVAAGFRPQNLLIGAAPLLLAAWRDKRRAVAAFAIIAVGIAATYGTAAWITGWERYRTALAEHSAYITTVDSFRAPTRPALWRLFDDFFVRPYHAPAINAIITVLAAIAVLRHRRHVLLAIAAFGPFCLFALLMLDHFSASRFSIGYAPLIALLAADGLAFVARRFEPVAAALLVAFMIVWTWPAFRGLRTSVAPPVAAVDWLRNNADPHDSVIYVDSSMTPYADWYLQDYQRRPVEEASPPALWVLRQPGFYLREGSSNAARAQNFVRKRRRLWEIARQRYFEASVSPITERVIFGAGWYDEETSGSEVWRWMGTRSSAELPPIAGEARLTLALYAPLDGLAAKPNVTIRVNGEVVNRFTATALLNEREIAVHPRPGAANELVIETDQLVPLARDARGLGLRLNSIGWSPRG